MGKQQILEDLEALQDKVDKIGFKGQNEYDLFLREEIADYILEQFKKVKFTFELFSDHTCQSLGYKHLCKISESEPIK